jgi:L-rhamnose-H+ transport protein
MGSLLSMLVLNPARIGTPHGAFILLGTAVAIVGMVISGIAGGQREHNRRLQNQTQQEGEGTIVGKRRSLPTAIFICIGAGILSAIFNIGFAMAQPIIATAQSAGLSASAGTNLVWLLMLVSGSVLNILFCLWLLIRNRSFAKFTLGSRLYILTALMGIFWAGSIFIYGEASTRLGALGPAIGWPLFLTTGLLVSNVCGVIAGEWRATAAKTRLWMISGLAVLVLAILVLGKAGAM